VVENSEGPFQDTMPMSKEAASLANAMVGTLKSISGGLKQPSQQHELADAGRESPTAVRFRF
jgi:hypothetical protein